MTPQPPTLALIPLPSLNGSETFLNIPIDDARARDGRVCARTWSTRGRNNPFIIYYFSWLRKAIGHKENAHTCVSVCVRVCCGEVAVLLVIFTNWKIMLIRKGWTGERERGAHLIPALVGEKCQTENNTVNIPTCARPKRVK